MEYRLISCLACRKPLCKVETRSEINKSYKCPHCGAINHYNGKGHIKTYYEVSEIRTSSGKRVL